METSLDNVTNTAKIILTGKIYVEEATEIREKLLQYMDDGLYSFIFDFSAVEYIDSSGLGVLVAVQKKSNQKGGRVTIQGLKGEVKELFELTRLTKVLDIV
jgi:anti-sigma B factor antagonist